MSFDIITISSISLGIVLFSFLFFLLILLKTTLDCGYILALSIFFNFISLIFYFIIPFITPLLLLLIVPITFIILSIIKDGSQIFKHLLTQKLIPWYLFIIYTFFSLFWSSNPIYGSNKLILFTLVSFLPSISIYITYIAYKKLTWQPSLVLGFIYILIIIIFGGIYNVNNQRFTLSVINPIWISRAAFYLIAISIFQFSLNKLIRTIIISLALFVALLTQSKGPFLSFVLSGVTTYLIYIYFDKDIGKKRKIYNLIKITLLSGIILITLFYFLEKNFEFISNSRIGLIFDLKKLYLQPSSINRIYRYIRAIKLFIKNPIIGQGIGSYALTSIRDYPHNLFLECLSELGIIGFVLFYWPIYQSIKNTALKYPLVFFLILQAVINSMLSGDLTSNQEILIFSIIPFAYLETKESIIKVHENN